MSNNNQTTLLPPEPPEPYMCCESGCGEACVFEIYYEQKRAYDALLKQQRADDFASSDD